MTSLPEPLRGWRDQLEGVPERAIEAIGPLLGGLHALVGPMLQRPEPGGGEPDGLSGLSRRGPWERLLITEWAVADVAPEEFVRRATSGEQLFGELAYRTPQSGRSCQVLLDTGPDQIGMPRLVQLALLVVLARRAAEASADFQWGALRGAMTRAGWGENAWLTFLAGRTVHPPTAAHLRDRLDADAGPEREVWLVGGPEVLELPGATSLRVCITESLDPDDPDLLVRLVRPGGALREIRLPSITPRVAKQAFRKLRPDVPIVREQPGGIWRPSFRFNDEGTRLLGVYEDGTIAGVKIDASKRSRRPKLRSPGRGRLVAIGWHDQKPIWVAHHERQRVGGLAWPAEWPSAAPESDEIGAMVHYIAGWTSSEEASWVCFVNGDQEAFRLQYAVSDTPERLPWRALALGRRSGVPLVVTVEASRTQFRTHAVRDRDFTVVDSMPGEALRAWIGGATHLQAGGSGTGLIALQYVPHEVLVVGLGKPVEIQVAPSDVVWGVTWVEQSGKPAPALLVSTQSQRLHLVTRRRRIHVSDSGPVVYASVSPGSTPLLAWMTEDQHIVVCPPLSDQALLRLVPERAR